MKNLLAGFSRSVRPATQALLLFLSSVLVAHAAFPAGKPVSPYITGQNYWYQPPDSIYPTIMDSGVTMVRIGGHQPDLTVLLTNEQILKQVDNIQGIGAEPLIQVSRSTSIDAVARAADTVNFINVVHGRGVKYWCIGNEPDLGSPYGAPMSEADLALNVGNYTRAISYAMRDVDPTIHISALDMAWFSSTKFNALLGGAADITGKDDKGRYYVDGINYHRYPFANAITRAAVLNEMHAGFEATVVPLLARMAFANALHGRVGADALDWGLTEFNMSYSNPPTTINNPAGLGVSSFLNGQFFAEYYRVGMKHGVHSMNTWSMLEGGGAGAGGDLGYLGGSWAAPIKRSSYYHMQMVADYLLPGGYLPGTSASPSLGVVSTSSSDQSILSVMLMNEDDAVNQAFSLRLNDEPVVGAGSKVNVSADLAHELSGVMDAQSTAVLLFDVTGALKQRITYSLARYLQNLPPLVETFTGAGEPPAVPMGLTLSSGDARASLMWEAASEAASYTVKRSLVSGGPYVTIAQNVITTSYTDMGLTNGATYYYVVSTTNPLGESSDSHEVVALPQALLPEVSISIQAESLVRTSVGATTSQNNESAASGGAWIQLNASTATGGPYMEFTTPTIPAGTYGLKLTYKSNPSRGIHSFSVDGTQVGTVDQYLSSATFPTKAIAPITFATDGTHVFRLTVTGKNPAATNYLIAADRFVLVQQEGVAAATIALSTLNHVYDGTPKAATVTTSPAGLATTVTYDGSTTAPTAPGSYTVIAKVTAVGYAGSSSGTLVIRDTIPPVLTVSENLVVEATSAAGAVVNFSASALDFIDGPVPVEASPVSGSTFPLGTTTVNVSAKDAAGNTATGLFTVTVTDTTAPVIESATASATSLWPANHKLVPITITAVTTDAVGAVTRIISITSNEPDNGLGDGDTAGDFEITGALTANLRAERSGQGTGRIYTILLEASDEAGNSSTQSVAVIVPHHQSGK